jgi:glycerol-3-phosphate O-acyltransferase
VSQNYVRNLIDFQNSAVLNLHIFDRIEGLLAKGDNVVVLANHQTEADPGGILAMLAMAIRTCPIQG